MQDYTGFPLFRMNRLVVRYWLAGGMLKAHLASVVAKTWRTGVVMLNPSLYAVGTVSPRGVPSDLPPPYSQRFEMWQICNKPSARYSECACRNYYDPESGDAWGKRDAERGRDIHHPHCQFDRRATAGWKQDHDAAFSRLAQGQAPQARPDEWIRTRENLP